MAPPPLGRRILNSPEHGGSSIQKANTERGLGSVENRVTTPGPSERLGSDNEPRLGAEDTSPLERQMILGPHSRSGGRNLRSGRVNRTSCCIGELRDLRIDVARLGWINVVNLNVILQGCGTAAHHWDEAARPANLLPQKLKLQMLLESDLIRSEQAPKGDLITFASELMETNVSSQAFTKKPCQPTTRLSQTSLR